MSKNQPIIIIPSHTNYLDVCINFIELLNKNWKDCPYKIVISLTGDEKKTVPFGCEVIFNSNATLPECIYNVTNKYRCDYYISFLGDAFINKKIDTSVVIKIVKDMKKNSITYCNLIPKQSVKKMQLNQYSRYINTRERYGISFVAFIASYEFIQNEFSNKITDLNFEAKYLNVNSPNFHYKDKIILNDNFLNLEPAICKGKWDRHKLKKLKKNNPQINFCERDVLDLKTQIINDISESINFFMPNKLRYILKKIVHIIFKYDFTID